MQVKEILNTEDKYGATLLQLEISGKNVCYQILNSIRKVAINQIPIYAFHPDKIHITRNSSVFDNSELSCHLSQLPITKFNHKVKYLPERYYKNVKFSDAKLEKHPEDLYQINFSTKAKNSGPESILNVTTNDLAISITSLSTEPDELTSDDLIPPKEKYSSENPILLVQLRPGEELECSMKAVLAVGELDGIFNASNTYWTELSANKYLLSVESSGQLPEYEILIRSCEILIEKLNTLKENLTNNQYNSVLTQTNSLILEIVNEDHTCGNPICWVLQNYSGVKFAGVNKPDFMQKVINIVVQCEEKINPIDMVLKSIDKCIEIYSEYKTHFVESYGKYYSKSQVKTKDNKKTESKSKTK